jgi:hypothetical protein
MVGIIRPLRFKTLSEAESNDRSLSRNDATAPLLFATPGKRFLSKQIRSSDDTVSICLKRFFDPDVGIPFILADVAKHFPLELLQRESEAAAAADVEIEAGTTLLDSSEEDVLFTVGYCGRAGIWAALG